MSTTSTTASQAHASNALPLRGRGPLSDRLVEVLVQPIADSDLAPLPEIAASAARGADLLQDDDIQLSLFLLCSLHYGAFPRIDPRAEWEPELIRTRMVLTEAIENLLRRTITVPEAPTATADAVAEWLFALTAPEPGPSLSRFIAKKASDEQAQEFLMHRSIYTLREADPHSWAIPRLTGRAKSALVEIQSDEYGGGRPHRMHAEIFARTMRGAGLDSTYGAYVDRVSAATLASLNTMSIFGLQHRLRGAIVGHLAAFEMTSSLPNRSYGDGFRRLGYGPDVTEYFDEHVEADAVHEQIAARDLAGALAEDEPDLLADILFGAAACLYVDGAAGDHMLGCFEEGRSSLRDLTSAEG
jgi:hypothetical protein